jgi:hypothetical protein
VRVVLESFSPDDEEDSAVEEVTGVCASTRRGTACLAVLAGAPLYLCQCRRSRRPGPSGRSNRLPIAIRRPTVRCVCAVL